MIAPSPARSPLRLGAMLLLAAIAPVTPVTPVSGAEPAPAASSPKASRFTYLGLEPVAAGQTQALAEAALGQALKAEPVPPARAASSTVQAGPAGPARPAAAAAASGLASLAGATRCQYHGVASQPGVRYTVAAGVVSRVETRDARYATVSGVHVGDPIDRARQAYGQRLSVASHPYFDKGHVLTVYSPDRRFALVMESNDAGRIITLRGGRMPDIAWLEGCS